MVKIQLDQNEERILAILRELYLKHKKDIPTDYIYHKAQREGIADYQVRKALKDLSYKKLVFRNDMFWKPKFELRQEQAIQKTGVPYTTSKIMDCLRKIGRPAKPNEILSKFIEIYGMPENTESFLRYVRTLGEDTENHITRDEKNNYWIKDKVLNVRDTTFDQFISGSI